jgi:hypothetical protein
MRIGCSISATLERKGRPAQYVPSGMRVDHMPISRQKEERMWALAEKFAKSGDCGTLNLNCAPWAIPEPASGFVL